MVRHAGCLLITATLGCGTDPAADFPDVVAFDTSDAVTDARAVAPDSPDVALDVTDGARGGFDVSPDRVDASSNLADVPALPGDLPTDTAPAEPDFAAIPWNSPGYGVFYRDAQNPRGNDVFIGYAGYAVAASWAQAWVAQLYTDALRPRGIRHVYAVQGPRDASYGSREIGNSLLIAHLLPRLSAGARILVAAHSSGSFVAHELLGQLYARGLDPTGLTRNRAVYWNLDGGSAGLTPAIVTQLRRGYFVWAATGAVQSPNASTMRALGMTYASAGGALAIAADGSGCRGTWCVHMVLISDRPHDPDRASAMADYANFDAAHPVATAWLARTNFGAP